MDKLNIKSALKDISKKNIIYILGAVGIIFLAISALSSEKPPEEAVTEKEDYCTIIEEKLEKILPEISSVGKVDVMITAENLGEVIPAKNEGEKDNGIIVLNQKGGGEDIRIIEEISPRIQGVIIVADGGRSSRVKIDLTEAVSALLGVDTHKIKVFERKIK